jgi:serine/threonine protein kinase
MPIIDSETIRVLDTAALGAGSDFGTRYRIEYLVGQGGMGRVYKAWDKSLDRDVAIKVVRPGAMADTEALRRFKQELLLASKISHKNILRIHDMGEVGDVKFISMAYVEGPNLHQILQENSKLPFERILSFARQLAEALAAAHAEGVVHRDFKPQNILVAKDDRVYVTDFGLAKSFQDEDIGMTRPGAILGTPRYMSPEQVEGTTADHRSDLYAYGLVLYEMVTGDIPFTGESTLKVMYQRIQEKPKSPKLFNPDLPNWFERSRDSGRSTECKSFRCCARRHPNGRDRAPRIRQAAVGPGHCGCSGDSDSSLRDSAGPAHDLGGRASESRITRFRHSTT